MDLDFLRSMVSNGTILLYVGIEKNSVTPSYCGKVVLLMGLNKGGESNGY